jgi:tripeptide aminopeptidase
VASEFVASLPQGELAPEVTGGYEGFLHPYRVEASVDRTSVKVLVRDFVTAALKDKEALVVRLAHAAVARRPGASVAFAVEESYRNMREILDQHPHVVEHAREAMRRAGIVPVERPIRGGTDGSRLSFMGLPTPNLFAGEHNFHSRLEWVSAQDMDKAAEVIVRLAEVWEERSGRR